MEEGEGVSGGLHANFAIWEGQNAKYMDMTRDEGQDAKTYWPMTEHNVLFR
jgi:hypothetical protein